MNLDHLRYFYDSFNLGSISKAAQKNLVGQPTITKAILKLEEELGVSLTTHERNQFILTEEGYKVVEACPLVFSSVDRVVDSVRSTVDISGEVNFACQSSMAESSFLAKSLKILINKFPALQPKLHLGRTDMVKQWLNENKVEFAITINNRDFNSFATQHIQSGQFVFVKKKSSSFNIKESGVFVTEETREVKQVKKIHFKETGSPLAVQMEIGSWSVIKNFVLQGLGIGFVPDYLVEKDVKAGRLEVVGGSKYKINYEIIVVSKPGKYLPKRSLKVIESMKFG